MQHIPHDKDPGLFLVNTLKNGIMVFHKPAEQLFGMPKVACSVLVQAGGRDDPKGKEGSAHFFEHMPFRGTKNYPNVTALTQDIENNGGYVNAFTTDEATGYEIIVPTSMIQEGIKRISDMLLQPLLRPEDIEIERNVIIEELHNKLSSVNFYARQELYKGLLGEHPLVYAVIGTEEALKSIQKPDLEAFHSRFYNASNVSLFFAGTYVKKELLDLCEAYFGQIKAGEKTQREVTPTPQPLKELTKVFTPKQYNRSVYYLGRIMPPSDLQNALCVKLFTDMLTRGMNSPLNQEIREKRGLAYSLGLRHEVYKDVGMLTFVVSTRFGHMPEVHRIFWEQAERILHDQARFDEVKHMIKQAIIYREFSVGALVDMGIDSFLDYDRVVTLDEYLGALESLSLDEVKAYMTKFLKPDEFLNIRVNCEK